ncbi:hypothetical protein [Kitasatospora sp. NPDC051914]|uniref:hypothetical protein n=1 Tax=Kitasatospora sp. NPDC051914 TaxID=3154945 RepID=UPI003432963D
MTLDGFAAAERIAATLDVLAEALLDERATHHPVESLTAVRRDGHSSAEELFGLRISPGGPGVLTVRGLGTVVEAGTARSTGSAAGATAALAARYGAGEVCGVPVDGTSGDGGAAPAAFQLPVLPEPGDSKLRPPFTAPLAALASDRPTRGPEELSTGSGVEVRLVVPTVFHPLTARGGGAAVAEHLAEVAEEVFAGSRAAERRTWSVLAASLADEAAAAGVVFAGLCALDAGGRTSHASLTVSFHPHSGPADELAVRLADARPHAEVWTVLLPAGPAALLVEPRTSPVPAPVAADGQRRWAISSVVEAVLPLPDGASALVLQLGTVQADDWELYTAAFADVLQSVQLGWDGVLAAPPQAAAQQAVPAAAQAPAPEPIAPPVPAPPVPVPPAPVPTVAPEAPTLPQASFEPVPAAPPAPPMPPVPPMPPTVPAPAEPAPVLASAPAPEGPKGTPVRVPPPDFNPFAPPAPTPAAATTEAEADEAPAGSGKGTPVRVPPPDFNPFAPPAPTPAAPAAAPAPVAAAPAAAPAVADPFGTVVSNEPQDPFGTVTSAPAAAPAAVAAPAPAAPVAPPAEEAPAGSGKGTPVRVPPPDFNPFAPPAPTPAAATTEAEADEAPAGSGKGTPVRVPPPDFNPFAPPAPTPAAPAAAPPAPEEPPAYNPFG